MKILKKIGIVLLLILIIAQFFGPEKNDGNIDTVNAFIAETNPTEEVLTIMKTSCFDCHSAKTNYPWYNSITPVNYWLDDMFHVIPLCVNILNIILRYIGNEVSNCF